jgi:hypothetical protein
MSIRQINVITGVETVGEYTASEIAEHTEYATGNISRAWEHLRFQRDQELAKSDWMSFGDSPDISDAWTAYRKKLRDLPATLDDTTVLETITWPTEPA